jgi:hypothetical protein
MPAMAVVVLPAAAELPSRYSLCHIRVRQQVELLVESTNGRRRQCIRPERPAFMAPVPVVVHPAASKLPACNSLRYIRICL